MVLRHKERNADGCDDAQLREYAAAMDARRLHENQRCRGEKHGLTGGDNQGQCGKQLRVLVAVQSETAGEIGRGQHKAGEGKAQALSISSITPTARMAEAENSVRIYRMTKSVILLLF